MTRGQRLMLAATALSGAALGVWLLLAASSAAEGPLAMTLDRVGGAVDALEHYARERVHGPGRRRALAWFEATRADRARLADPEVPLLGAYVGAAPLPLDGIVDLERHVATTFPLIHIYSAWGDGPEHQFPHRAAMAIWNVGSAPVITWEPWLSVFESARHPQLPLRDARDLRGLAAVARGDYDFYVDRWAAAAARFGHPVFLRFAHEMNDPYRYPWGPQHNAKEEFIAAWRHVVERFRAAGAGNVVWVWSPHVAYEYWELYYPGDDVVDWVATGALNFGPIAQWSRWWRFDEIFGTHYPRLAGFGKPIMVAEFGSLAVGGDRQAWYEQALRALPTTYPRVRALLFFHTAADQTVTYQQVDWTITRDPALAARIAAALRALGPAAQ